MRQKFKVSLIVKVKITLNKKKNDNRKKENMDKGIVKF